MQAVKPMLKRTVAFLITASVLIAVVMSVSTDREHTFSLTAKALFEQQLLPELLETWRAERGIEEETPVILRFSCMSDEPAICESLDRALNRSRLVELTELHSAPTLTVEDRNRAQYVVLLASLSGLTEPVSGSHRVGDGKSVLPPLAAILIALFFRRVLLAMVAAVVVGALLQFEGRATGHWTGPHEYYWNSATDEWSLYIIGFTVALVGMVTLATRAGGSQGLIDQVAKYADSARSTRIATFLMGLVVFFDDYANTIVVGTTVRPMSDRRRISREKLAYLIDSTAAPVAGLALISTWIAFEVGLMDELFQIHNILNAQGEPLDGYTFFVQMLPVRFYCLFCLFFVFVGALTSRDFGPMLTAERRALETGEVLGPDAKPLTSRAVSEILPPKGIPCRWYNAVIPIVCVVLSVIVGMFYSGQSALGASVEVRDLLETSGSFEGWRRSFGAANSGVVLFWSSIVGSLIAFLLAVGQRLLSVGQAIAAWLRGIPAMGLAMGILISAWSIQAVCKDLGTDVYLVSLFGDTMSEALFPLLIFFMAAGIAFATGTSWGTMGILLPVVLPLAWTMSSEGGDWIVMVLSTAAVLDGAIMGDHCSPISDTTVMSSMASSCDHVDHVRTQMPYAITCMGVAIIAYLLSALHYPGWFCLLVGAVLILAIFKFYAKPIQRDVIE
jgi:Na+/H+ antiporter NhaC